MKKYLLLLPILLFTGCASNNNYNSVDAYSPVYTYKWQVEKEDGSILFGNKGTIVNNQTIRSAVKNNDQKYTGTSIIMTVNRKNPETFYIHLSQTHEFKLTNIIHVKNEMADIHLPQNTKIELITHLAMKHGETAVVKFKSPYGNEVNQNYVFKLTLD